MVEPFNSSVEMEYDKMVYENKGWGQNMTGGAEMSHDEMSHDEMSPEMSPEMLYDEMVYNKEDDKIMAGGYSVNSVLLNQGIPAAYADHVGGKGEKYEHEKVSDRFKHLAVPVGLYLGSNYSNTKNMQNVKKKQNSKNMQNSTESSVINDDLYEKLLKLAEGNNNEHNTKKKSNTKKKNNTKKKSKKGKTKKSKKSINSKTKRKY